MNETVLINRIENSGLITIDLESFYPELPIYDFDLKDHLFHGLILKEKEFRETLKVHDWANYKGGVLCLFCSTDAIIPVWAFMLVSSYASPFADQIFTGNREEFLKSHYKSIIAKLDVQQYADQRVVIKGCSDKQVPASAYTDITSKLFPYVQSLMYGEPCSTVPVFKRPRKLDINN